MTDGVANVHRGTEVPARPTIPRFRPTPLLAGSLLSLVVAFGWAAFAVSTDVERHVTSVVAWLIVPFAMLLTAEACRRAGRSPRLPAPGRALWSRLPVTLLLFAAGMTANAAEVWADHNGNREPGWFSMACYAVGALHLVWTLLRVPTGNRPRRQLLTLGLDIGAVVIAAALYPIYFWMNQLLYADRADWLPALFVAGVLEFIAVVVIVKVTVAGPQLVDRAALILLALGVLAGISVAIALPLLGVDDRLDSGQLATPAACFLIVCAADRQVRAAGRGTRRSGQPQRQRAWSVIPYVAIGATDVLLLVAVGTEVGPFDAAWVVAVAAVVLTGLVVGRQVAALHENGRLLRSLDGTLAEIRSQERRFRALVQNSTDIVLITDRDDQTRFATPSTFRVLGFAPDELPALNPMTLIHPDDAEPVRAAIDSIADEPRGVVTYHARVRHVDGSWRMLEIVSTNLYDDPDVRGLVSNARDVTERRRYQDQLSHQATHDGLTRLPNRTLFLERTQTALAELAEFPDAPVTVALIDLDDFKTINDRLGHGAGDELLVALADRLRHAVPPGQVVARLGGDEFAVLLVGSEPEQATALAEALIDAFCAPVPAGGHDLLVQASIGLADARLGDDNTELLRRADVAMYAAKEAGKGRYAHYDADMDRRSIESARMGAQLRQALDNGELRMVYQPIVTLPDGALTGVEALVRWRTPDGQSISPARFVPVAERNGLIVGLGEWALRTACTQAVRWRDRPGGSPLTSVNVNVSARQLREPGFAERVRTILADVGLAPECLTVEVTETAVFDGGRALDELRALDDLGVRIALDDFGTGHSSLGLLRTCPVDVLKVDRSFVEGITGTTEQAAIATSLIEIAKGLGLRAVAEGVESAAQAERLYELGYQYAQGFHFAGAMDVDQIDALLERLDDEARVVGDLTHS
ncbi:putative bifunctional diguanylate cyclase/phosphodiesterase [Cryptosporangium aurantiacum]|uniref:putative bifunctional diguanylate cyclase/phosphodiesterase n=1 Tax=Cryptosporangium aurantiacum TaxID=134849 RepID=UPI00093259AC|nr:EAL domain-containing protein [Cryptosporangium aurantiacum]